MIKQGLTVQTRYGQGTIAGWTSNVVRVQLDVPAKFDADDELNNSGDDVCSLLALDLPSETVLIERSTVERQIHKTKIARAIALGNWHAGPETTAAVMEQVPAEVISECSARVIAAVASAINSAYHAGRASTGAELIDSDLVFVSDGPCKDKAYLLSDANLYR